MAQYKPSSFLSTICIFFMLLVLLPHARSLSFNFSSLSPNSRLLWYQGDAFTSGGALQLTRNQVNDNLTDSVGRVSYVEPLHLWNDSTGELTDFLTHFSFVVKKVGNSVPADGLTFFLVPLNTEIPPNSYGGYLGLVSSAKAWTPSSFCAVEFDSYSDTWDPRFSHIGININSVESNITTEWDNDFEGGALVNTWIHYDGSTKNLSVYLAAPSLPSKPILSSEVDLKKFLPPWVMVGFSGATGDFVATHRILSWEFNSTFQTSQSAKQTYPIHNILSRKFGSAWNI